MKLNKKGMSEAVLWIIRITMLIAVVAVINFIKAAALEQSLQTYDTEFYILNTKVLYSPAGLAYQSPTTGRTYPGIIDMNDMNETKLNTTITQNIPTKITVTDMSHETIKEIYFNRERFEILGPLTFSKKYDLINKTNYVLIKEGNELKQGLLTIQMVISR